MKIGQTNYRVNKEITASQVRLIGDGGKQVGVVALSEAFGKAEESKTDLIEIAPHASPPVVKLIEIGKFKYEEEKKKKKEKKGNKGGEIKEIRFSPFIAQGDYQIRLERIKEFLAEGNKIKAVVKFGGRQMNSKQFGYELIARLVSDLGENIVVDMEPKFIGRHLTSVISPRSTRSIKKEDIKEVKNEDKTKNQKDNN